MLLGNLCHSETPSGGEKKVISELASVIFRLGFLSISKRLLIAENDRQREQGNRNKQTTIKTEVVPLSTAEMVTALLHCNMWCDWVWNGSPLLKQESSSCFDHHFLTVHSPEASSSWQTLKRLTWSLMSSSSQYWHFTLAKGHCCWWSWRSKWKETIRKISSQTHKTSL